MIAHHWDAIETDLHDQYGIDTDNVDLMRSRSWRWLRLRILGLLTADTRLSRAMTRHTTPPPADPSGPDLFDEE